MDQVMLKPCMDKSCSPRVPCFQNYRGFYRVIRQLSQGQLLLEHMESGNYGLADPDSIIELPSGYDR